MVKYKELLIVFSFLNIYLNAFTQNSFNIKGKIYDSNKKPIPFVNIILFDPLDTLFVKGTITDSMGVFYIDKLKKRKVILKISSLGYLTKLDTLNLYSNSTDLGIIELQEDIIQLDGIVIKTKRPTVERLADRFILNLDNNNLIRGKNILQVIDKIPGVRVKNTGEVTMLGGQSISIMINDNLEYMTRDELSAYLSSMNAEDVKKLELITNPSSKYDAEGTGGILNIITEKSYQRGWSGYFTGSLSKGREWSQRLGSNTTFNYKKIYLSTFLSSSNTNFLNKSELIRKETTYSISSNIQDFFELKSKPLLKSQLIYDFTDKHTVKFSFNILNFNQINPLASSTFNESIDESIIQQVENNIQYKLLKKNTGFSYVQKIDSSGSNYQVEGNYIEYHSEQSSIIEFNSTKSSLASTNKTNLITVNLDFTKKINKLEFNIGTKYSQTRINLVNNYSEKPDFVLLENFLINNSQKYNEQIMAGYFNVEGKSGQITYQGGLRFEYTKLKADSTVGQISFLNRKINSLFPSLSITYISSKKDHLVSLSYSKRITRPDFNTLDPFIYIETPYNYIQGNPNILPEFVHSIDFSYTYNSDFIFSLFYNNSSNVIDNIYVDMNESLVDFRDNVGNNSQYGISLSKNFYVGDWWESYNNFSVFYNEQNFNYKAKSNNLNSWLAEVYSSQLFYINNWFDLSLDFSYIPRGIITSSYRLEKPIWQTDFSLSKSFLDDKLDIVALVSDIFYTSTGKYKILFPNDNIIYKDFEDNRKLTLSIKYKFLRGKKFETKEFKNNGENKRLKY